MPVAGLCCATPAQAGPEGGKKGGVALESSARPLTRNKWQSAHKGAEFLSYLTTCRRMKRCGCPAYGTLSRTVTSQ